MMAGIAIDRHVVCMAHDFDGMTPEYFRQFLLNEYIPAHKDELSAEEIDQIHQGIENKQERIFTKKTVNPERGKHRLSHVFAYVNPYIPFNNRPEHDFNGF